jgi:hypothetical protein
MRRHAAFRRIGARPWPIRTGWTIDVKHNAGEHDRFHVFYGSQFVRSLEPTAQGNSIPVSARRRSRRETC